MTRSSGLARLLGFGVTPIISAVGPLLLLPLLTRIAGAEGWAALATGQAIGAVAGTVALYSWQTFGPPQVAISSSNEAARHLLYVSLAMRGVLAAIVLPIAIAIAWVLTPAEWAPFAAVLCVSSTLMTGLTNSWYFVGRGDPKAYFLLETAPRSSAIVLSALWLLLGWGVGAYVATTLAAEVVVIVLACITQARRTGSHRDAVQQSKELMAAHARLTFSGLSSLGYTRASTPIVAAVDYGATASFAAADRMQNIARTVLRPLTQAFQSWVYESLDEPVEFRRRAFRATTTIVAAGIALGAGLAVGLPLGGSLLFSTEISTDWGVSIPLGVAVALISLSSSTATFYLVPLRKTGTVATSLLSTSALGVPLLVVSSFVAAPEGPLVVIACVEAVVAMWQVIVVRRWVYAGE